VAFIGRPRGAIDIGTQVYIADVVRDSTGHVVGITGLTFVVDLMTIGSPADSSHPQSAVGAIDLSADGTKLLAVIYDDIWMINLNPTGWIMAGATNLTRTPDFAEMYARWSPAADAIAFSGGGYAELGDRWWYSSNTNVFTMNPATGAVRQITTKTTHKGSRPSAEFPTWSPSGTHLLYGAETGGYGPRNSPCGTLVNDDLYLILSSGTQKTVNITNTAGTAVESSPRWGW
jgi:Tol biopolymer transport system component